MRVRGVLIAVLAFATILSGCTGSERDLESDAADREEWAQSHDAYSPIARLAGPQTIAPGALVWYSAQGSHDPDFIGAKSERREAQASGGVHYQDQHGEMEVSWSDTDRDTRGLGNGIREYLWQVDDGPLLVAPELTYRYGTDDGPIRFPFGSAAAGTHTLSLTVVDWAGDRDRIRMPIEVAEAGVASSGDLDGWMAVENGWSRVFTQTIDPHETGRCPLGYDSYDAARDHITMPWELLFFAESIDVTVTWDRLEAPAAAPTTTDALRAATTAAYGVNVNDVDMTLGHCARDGEWSRFATDSAPDDSAPSEKGSVDGLTFAQNVERSGNKAAYVAEWDHNAYLSGEGTWRGGLGTPVRIVYSFVAASDTSGGAL